MPYYLRPAACLPIVLFLLLSSSALSQTSEQAPAAKKSSLSILSDPGGAQVFINGVLYGKTPLHLSLPAGTYNLRLEKTGYLTVKEEVKVKEGEDTALDFELEEKE